MHEDIAYLFYYSTLVLQFPPFSFEVYKKYKSYLHIVFLMIKL